MRRQPPALIALTPGDLVPGAFDDLLARVRAAVAAGLRGVLLREPKLFDADFGALARSLRRELGPDRWLGLHDRVHLIDVTDTQAVHLGWSSLRPSEVSELRGDAVSIGFSAHAGDDPAAARGADYLFLSPVAPTASHRDPSGPDWREPLGVDGFRRERRIRTAPTWALGGVDASRARELRDAGADGVAVLGAILGRSSPEAAARATGELLGAWGATA